jgi:hypothetical protein
LTQVAAPPKAATPEKKTTPVPAALPEEVEFEFSDVVKIACLLCARQFKTLDQLKKHNKESDLHKVFFSYINALFVYTHPDAENGNSETLKTQICERWRAER